MAKKPARTGPLSQPFVPDEIIRDGKPLPRNPVPAPAKKAPKKAPPKGKGGD